MRLLGRAPTNYAERTHASPYWVIRYAHRRRYELLIAEVLRTQPQVLLDYGAGEADMLLTLLMRPDCSPTMRAIAYEPMIESLVEHLEDRPDGEPIGRIELVRQLEEVPDHSCDVISCGGVLEHLTIRERYRFYTFARRALRPGGQVIIDVPVELGPAVLIKNVGRRVLKADQREYTWRESVAATLGFKVFDPHRFDPEADDEFIESHKGFDYRLLKTELASQGFRVTRSVSSPISWLPAALANQEVILNAVIEP
jgi:SAM-dependent methyltransferase